MNVSTVANDAIPSTRVYDPPVGCRGGVRRANDQDRDPNHLSLLFPPTLELYHEAIKLAEKLREQQREAEELKKLVKEF